MKLVKEHINEVIKHLSARNEEEMLKNFPDIGDLVKKLRQISSEVKYEFKINIPVGSTVIIKFVYNNNKFKTHNVNIRDDSAYYWRLYKWYDINYKDDYEPGYNIEFWFKTFEELYAFLQQDE